MGSSHAFRKKAGEEKEGNETHLLMQSEHPSIHPTSTGLQAKRSEEGINGWWSARRHPDRQASLALAGAGKTGLITGDLTVCPPLELDEERGDVTC